MITKERQFRKMKNRIKEMRISRHLQDGKNAHFKALKRKTEVERAKGEARRAYRKKIAKEYGVRIERVKLTSRLEKGKASYVVK